MLNDIYANALSTRSREAQAAFDTALRRIRNYHGDPIASPDVIRGGMSSRLPPPAVVNTPTWIDGRRCTPDEPRSADALHPETLR